MRREVVICEPVRTPVGRGHEEKGIYKDVHPSTLLAKTYSEVIDRAGIDASEVEDVVGGDPGLTIRLLRFANSALSQNVVLGPWIHVSSELALLGDLRLGACRPLACGEPAGGPRELARDRTVLRRCLPRRLLVGARDLLGSVGHEIIEAHDGKIWLESRPDEGTKVKIDIPAIVDN